MNMPVDASQNEAASPSDFDDEISLLDLATALGEEKKAIAGITGAAAVLSIIVSLLLPVYFTAKTVVIPPQQQQSSASAALASLGALAGLAGGIAGVKTPDEMYLAFLKSDRISDAIIDRFGLMEYYKAKTRMDARKALVADAKIASDKKSGLITIEMDHKDPEQAAAIANAYIEELSKLLGKVAVTEAQQRRQFLENQLALTKDRLSQSEMTFRELQSRSGVLSLDAQTQSAMQATVQLRSQIAQREVQLSTLRSFATAENSDVQRLSAELGSLRAQLAKLEQGSGGAGASLGSQGASSSAVAGSVGATGGSAASSDAGSASGGTASKGLQTIRAFREVKYQEAIMDALVKQYELAKVDEAREGPLLQQVDVATAPERKSKPKRAMFVVVATMAGLFAGVLIAFVRRAMRNAAKNPEGAEKMAALKKAWAWR